MHANTTTITAQLVRVDDEFIDVIDITTGQEYAITHYEGEAILDEAEAGQEITCTFETEYVEDFAAADDVRIQHTLIKIIEN